MKKLIKVGDLKKYPDDTVLCIEIENADLDYVHVPAEGVKLIKRIVVDGKKVNIRGLLVS